MNNFSNELLEVQRLITMCPQPNSLDLCKLLAIQGAVLQREGMRLLAEASKLTDYSKRSRRILLATSVLDSAASCLTRAEVIVRRSKGTIDPDSGLIVKEGWGSVEFVEGKLRLPEPPPELTDEVVGGGAGGVARVPVPPALENQSEPTPFQ